MILALSLITALIGNVTKINFNKQRKVSCQMITL